MYSVINVFINSVNVNEYNNKSRLVHLRVLIMTWKPNVRQLIVFFFFFYFCLM